MAVHTRFCNFISYSGAIWRILTISVTAGKPCCCSVHLYWTHLARTQELLAKKLSHHHKILTVDLGPRFHKHNACLSCHCVRDADRQYTVMLEF